MRNAGGNLTIRDQLQAYSRLLVHAIPHPALRATFPPGEGKGAAAPEQPTILRIACQVAGGRKALPYGDRYSLRPLRSFATLKDDSGDGGVALSVQ